MMGYGMAMNVRRKLPASSKLYIFDVSKATLEKFKQEAGSHGEVIIASSSKEVTDKAVMSLHRIALTLGYYHLYAS